MGGGGGSWGSNIRKRENVVCMGKHGPCFSTEQLPRPPPFRNPVSTPGNASNMHTNTHTHTLI